MSDEVKELPWTDPVALAAAADRLRDLVTGGGWVDVANTPEDAIWDLLLIARDWIHSHPPTPDGPPVAAPERKAGERYVVVQPEGSRAVYANDADGHPHCIGYCWDAADAELLAHGHARLRALEAALRMVLHRWRFNNDQCHTHTWHDMADCKKVIEDALGAGPGVKCPKCPTGTMVSQPTPHWPTRWLCDKCGAIQVR